MSRGDFPVKRIPVGLMNVPASFQHALDLILTKYKWKKCLVYINDVIVYSTIVEEHIRHVDEILTVLKEA